MAAHKRRRLTAKQFKKIVDNSTARIEQRTFDMVREVLVEGKSKVSVSEKYKVTKQCVAIQANKIYGMHNTSLAEAIKTSESILLEAANDVGLTKLVPIARLVTPEQAKEIEEMSQNEILKLEAVEQGFFS